MIMRKWDIRTVRTWVIVLVFMSTGIGLAFHAGWGTLSSMGIAALSYICPLGSIEAFLATWTGVPRMVFALAAVVIVALLVGKAFCAWICPVPVFQRIFKSGKKRKPQDHVERIAPNSGERDEARMLETHSPSEDEGSASEGDNLASLSDCAPSVDGETDSAALCQSAVSCEGCPSSSVRSLDPLGGKRDGLRIDSRHGVLLGALLSTAIFGFPVFCLICPIGLMFATFIALWGLFGYAEVSLSLAVFPLVLILELLVLRKWCHRFCPISAIWSLLAKGNKTLVPVVEKSACLRSSGIDCDVCVKQCPEEVDPHSPSIPECTKCGVCAQECPAKAISFPLLKKPEAHEKSEVSK